MRTLTSQLLLLATSSTLLGAQVEPASVVDYGTFQGSLRTYGHLEMDAWKLGYNAFNFASELTLFFAKLKRDHNITVAVETGTDTGGTTVALALLFDQVHTVEILEQTFASSQSHLKQFSNVKCHLGSSEAVLHRLLPTLKNQRTLFYLDAHWQQHWPLLHELEEISRTHRDNCIVVIDDFKVPDRPEIGYDYTAPHECSYEYVKAHLDKVFSAYTCVYLIPRSTESRAKFVVIPKAWRQEPVHKSV
jgi:hypothetical protein